MRRLFFTLSILALFGLASAFPEGRCGSDGWPALGIVEVGTPAGIFYVDDRSVLANGVWLYEESNEIYDDENGHLQRGRSCDFVSCDDEVCADVGPWAPDRLVF